MQRQDVDRPRQRGDRKSRKRKGDWTECETRRKQSKYVHTYTNEPMVMVSTGIQKAASVCVVWVQDGSVFFFANWKSREMPYILVGKGSAQSGYKSLYLLFVSDSWMWHSLVDRSLQAGDPTNAKYGCMDTKADVFWVLDHRKDKKNHSDLVFSFLHEMASAEIVIW